MTELPNLHYENPGFFVRLREFSEIDPVWQVDAELQCPILLAYP